VAASAAALFCYGAGYREGNIMKIGLEIIGALVVALVVFIVFKLIGLAIHIAIVGAVVGLIVGFVAARMFRRE